MRVLSLFSGIGGADLALHALGCETVAHCEVDPYASSVFAKRFPDSDALGDIRDVKTHPGAFDIIVGGFPCQDISNAGKRAGLAGERSGLWSEFARLIGEAQPRLVLIENVSALLNRGLLQVLTDLHELGYEAEWDCIPAAAVGAPHLRDRIWLCAYASKVSWGKDVNRQFLTDRSDEPPAKMPRSGRMYKGTLWSREPIARRQTKRIDGRTYWNGVNLGDTATQRLWPTPEASDGKGGRVAKELGGIRSSGAKRSITLATAVVHEASAALLPTPSATSYGSNRGGAAGRVGPQRHSLESMARHGLWPTPTRAVGTGGPGRSDARTGGDNLRTAVAMAPTPAAADGSRGSLTYMRGNPTLLGFAAEGQRSKRLNPDWVEWLMGFPIGWTDLDCDEPLWLPWTDDPGNRTTAGVPERKHRLTCCGNALVPQVMHFVARRALGAIA